MYTSRCIYRSTCKITYKYILKDNEQSIRTMCELSDKVRRQSAQSGNEQYRNWRERERERQRE